jgi:hypothetical protein
MADRLGKTISEIEEISVDEYNEWMAYFAVIKEREDNERKTPDRNTGYR